MQPSSFFAAHPVFTHIDYRKGMAALRARTARGADRLMARENGAVLRVRTGLYAAVPEGSSPRARMSWRAMICNRFMAHPYTGFDPRFQPLGPGGPAPDRRKPGEARKKAAKNHGPPFGNDGKAVRDPWSG